MLSLEAMVEILGEVVRESRSDLLKDDETRWRLEAASMVPSSYAGRERWAGDTGPSSRERHGRTAMLND